MFQFGLVGYYKILFIYSRGFLFASVHATLFYSKLYSTWNVSSASKLLITALLLRQPPKPTLKDILIIGIKVLRYIVNLAINKRHTSLDNGRKTISAG